MMALTPWFSNQLQMIAEGFVWGIEQVPTARRTVQPPNGLGEWTAARHIFHLLTYEKTLALPGMRQWLDEPSPSVEDGDEDVAWGLIEPGNIEKLITEFRKVRAEQIALLPKFDDSTWNSTRETVWGSVTLLWVVSKTYQHTAEHISDVMRIALFWDIFAAR